MTESVTLSCSHLCSPFPVSERLNALETGGLADAASRSNLDITHPIAAQPLVLADWVAEAGAKQIIMPFGTLGPSRDWLTLAEPHLAGQGSALCEHRRACEEAIWPHATAEFFKVGKSIPQILEQTIGTELL